MGLDLTCRGILGRTAERVRCPLDFKPVWETEGRSWLHNRSDPKVVIPIHTQIYWGNKTKKGLKNKSTISLLILQLNGDKCKGASTEERCPLFFKSVIIAVALRRRLWERWTSFHHGQGNQLKW